MLNGERINIAPRPIWANRLSAAADRLGRRIAALGRSEVVPDDSGFVFVYVTIVMLVLLGFLGLVVDLGYGGVKHSMAQTAADAAALGAMQEIVSGSTEAGATTAANLLTTKNGFAASNLTLGYLDSSGTATLSAGQVVTTTAALSSTYTPLFLKIIGINSITVGGAASAIAGGSLAGGSFPCVFCVLSGGANPALYINNNGSVHITNGALIVNSSATGGLTVNNNASASASSIGIVGNASVGNNGTTSPAPTHITAIADPLANMPMPTMSGNTGTSVTVTNNASQTIPPGVYNTIIASNNAHITLSAGTYFITNALIISNNGIMSGNNVLLYFTCGGPVPAACLNTGQAGGYLDLENNASNTATAPTSGPYKGLTILYDRHDTSPITLGNNAGGFSGTMYARSAALHLQNNATTLDTRIIVDTAVIENNAAVTITINQTHNYTQNVPGLVQ